jgi:hypothetical protein
MVTIRFPHLPAIPLRQLVLIPVLVLLLVAVTGILDRAVDAVITPLSPTEARQVLHRIQVGAGVAYVSVRALGRVVAVASSTTVNANVGALVNGGASLEVGNVLQPFEQLLDGFGDVLMVSLVSVTIQLVLVDVLDAFALQWVLPAGLGLLAIALVMRSAPKGRLRRLSHALIAGAILAKLLLPVGVQGTEALSDRFLRERAAKAEQVLNEARTDMAAAIPSFEESPGRSWYNPRRVTDRMAALAPEHMSEALNKITDSVERSVEASLTWMAVFVMQTILFPLTIAALSMWLFRMALRRRPLLAG